MTSLPLTDAILAACDAYADRPAIELDGHPVVTYRQAGARIRRIANTLQASGFCPGHRMLFSIRPAPDSMIFLAGVLASGGSVVFADPGMTPALFDARVRCARPTVAAVESLIYAATARGPLGALSRRAGLSLPRVGDLDVAHIRSGPRLPGVPSGSVSVSDIATGRRLVAVRPSTVAPPDGEALVVFTSGTTAAPRGVVHDQASLFAGFRAGAAALHIDPGSVVLTDQAMIGLPALLSGAHWVMPRLRMSAHAGPATMARILSSRKDITHTFIVPGELSEVLDRLPKAPPVLRAILCGGAPVTPGLARSVDAALPGVDLYGIYGMTELVPIAVATGAAKCGWAGPGDPIGTVVDGVHTRIVDGELYVSGSALCLGYLSPIDGAVQPVDEVATGDLAARTPEGLALLGRSKDMIIRGTVNIYPGLYEPVISAIDGVRDCALVGVGGADGETTTATADPEVVLALVVDDPAAVGRVRAALDDLVDRGAQPDRIAVIEQIPRSGRTRKPDRRALAALLATGPDGNLAR